MNGISWSQTYVEGSIAQLLFMCIMVGLSRAPNRTAYTVRRVYALQERSSGPTVDSCFILALVGFSYCIEFGRDSP